MTTPSVSARPYRVFVRVPDASFDNHVRLYTHVDRGLSPAEVNSVSSPSDIKKLTLASLLLDSPLMPVVVVALAAWGLTQWGMESAVGGTAWWTVTLTVSASIVWAFISNKSIARRVKRLTDELIEEGRLANPHERRSDLRRIQTALTVLQATSGTDFDELARQAAIAVLDQELNAPSPKALAIAESKASDPDTAVIRVRVLAQKAQRDADVARAESLIFDLERFVAMKSQESMTAD